VLIAILTLLITGVLFFVIQSYRKMKEAEQLSNLIKKYKIWQAKGYDADIVKTYLEHIKKGG
jgi:hypothetical protein